MSSKVEIFVTRMSEIKQILESDNFFLTSVPRGQSQFLAQQSILLPKSGPILTKF